MVDELIILGGHIQALGLARQAKRKKVKVTLVIPDQYSVARFSRCVDRVVVRSTEEQLVQYLHTKKREGSMLFPTSDEYIEFIVRHYDSLKESYLIALPDLSTIRLFADKIPTYQFAEKNGIPHPWCKYPQSLSDVEFMAERMKYPVVIKPAVMYSFHRKFGKKAFLCESIAVLRRKVKDIVEADYPVSSLIFQEYLSGGAKNLYSYGFFAVNGVVKSSVTVNRVRQNPMDFGNSTTFAITADIPAIEIASKRIIELTKYTGMGEVEFMYDKGEYKFLEINTRAWKWHTISEGRGFSFIEDWIDWLNRGEIMAKNEGDIRCAWVERVTDFAVIVKGLFRGQVKLGEAVRSYGQRKISAVWKLSDPLPAIMYLIMSPVLYIKRY